MEKISVTFFGDSIMSCKKGKKVSGWTKKLQKKINKKYPKKFLFYKKTIVGLNSSGLLNILPEFFAKINNKNIIFIQIGINDSWHYNSLKGFPVTNIINFKNNLIKIIKKTYSMGFKKIIFLGYHSIEKNRIEVNKKNINQNLLKFIKAINNVSKKNKIDFIDIKKIFKKKKISRICYPIPDGVHLNNRGANFYSNVIFDYITKKII